MTPRDVVEIVGTAVAVGATLCAGCIWFLRALIARDVTPFLTALASEAKGLADAFREAKANAIQERVETHRILEDLSKIVHDHDTRLTVIERLQT